MCVHTYLYVYVRVWLLYVRVGGVGNTFGARRRGTRGGGEQITNEYLNCHQSELITKHSLRRSTDTFGEAVLANRSRKWDGMAGYHVELYAPNWHISVAIRVASPVAESGSDRMGSPEPKGCDLDLHKHQFSWLPVAALCAHLFRPAICRTHFPIANNQLRLQPRTPWPFYALAFPDLPSSPRAISAQTPFAPIGNYNYEPRLSCAEMGSTLTTHHPTSQVLPIRKLISWPASGDPDPILRGVPHFAGWHWNISFTTVRPTISCSCLVSQIGTRNMRSSFRQISYLITSGLGEVPRHRRLQYSYTSPNFFWVVSHVQ